MKVESCGRMLQNIEVAQDGATFVALTDLTRELVAQSPNAGAVMQSAIDALAATGGVVTIGPGLFPIAAPIRLADQVWLRGGGRATRLVVEPANEAGIGLLGSGVSGAVVSDLALQPAQSQGGVAGIVLDACGDCKLRGVFCADFAGYGIWARNSSFLCEIGGCSLAGNAKANLYLDELRAGPFGSYLPNLIANCVIYGGGTGIECRRAIALSLVGCLVHQAEGAAYHIHSRSNAVAISGSRSYQTSGDAVVVERSDECSLSGNVFCWQTGHGLVVRDSHWGTLSGNQIVDSGSYNPGGPDRATTFADLPADLSLHNGVNLLSTRGYQVSGNAIFNWSAAPPLGYGVWEDEQCFKNSIVGNSVNYYQSAAVRSAGRESIARDNTAHAERPYNDMERAAGPQRDLQSFGRELTAQFLALQTRRGAP
jgi:parallel beta-helix repeat protein